MEKAGQRTGVYLSAKRLVVVNGLMPKVLLEVRHELPRVILVKIQRVSFACIQCDFKCRGGLGQNATPHYLKTAGQGGYPGVL